MMSWASQLLTTVEINVTFKCLGVTREVAALHNPQHYGANNQLMSTDPCWFPKDASWIHSFVKNKNGVGPVTFCHRYNLSEGGSGVPKLADIRSSQLAFKRTILCAPRLTWIEYDGMSKVGIWFPNMVECRFSWSQSSWARQSRDLQPQIGANSNRLWMKVSSCEILSHLWNGTNLWRVAYEAEESDGHIRFVSDAGCGD